MAFDTEALILLRPNLLQTNTPEKTSCSQELMFYSDLKERTCDRTITYPTSRISKYLTDKYFS